MKLWSSLLVLLFFVLVLFTQLLSGTYGSELAHWPDEPSHVTSALMVLDYITSGVGEHPMRFAETYYVHYPKVAIGVWPPFYYLIAAIWMLIFGASNISLLVLSGVFTAALVSLVALLAWRMFGDPFVAILLGLLLLALPEIQFSSSLFMLDIPVALFQILALMCLIEYFRTERLSYAVYFALVTSVAMLTKGNAIALILLPLFLMLLMNRWDLLRQGGIYLGYAIIALVGLPWQLFSMRALDSSALVQRDNLVSRTWEMCLGYSEMLVQNSGWLIVTFALLGLVVEASRLIRRQPGYSLEAAGVISLLFATLLFHCIAPIPGPDHRYLTTAYPSLVLLFGSGLVWLATYLPSSAVRRRLHFKLVSLFIIAGTTFTFSIPSRPTLGFGDLAQYFSQEHLRTENVFLINSDSNGEGAFIVEMALRDQPRPQRVIFRGSKLLSDNTWSETEHKPRFGSVAELAEFLRQTSIDIVVVDRSMTMWPQDRDLLITALESSPDLWEIAYEQSAVDSRRGLTAYRRIGPKHSEIDVQIPLPYTLGRDLYLPAVP